MKKLTLLSLLILLAAPLFAQLPTWTSNSSGREQYTGTYNTYDYELWNQNSSGTAVMKVTGDNGQGANAKGGTFEAEWSNTCNVLFRSGRKWGSNSTQNHTQIGNMTFDYEAEWSTTDGAKMLGVYGWAYFTSARRPTRRENGTNLNFSNQIEYYIIQDRGDYNPATNQQLCGSAPYGEATINGVLYEFRVCDRINQPMLTGNGDFKQFFSIPKSQSAQRTRGIIDVTAHFNAWHAAGMYMDGPLYEVAMKIESYNCNSGPNGRGSGKVTKNILTIGGSSTPSSNSGGGSSSSSTGGGGTSSSSSAPTQATNCSNFIGTLPASPNPPANPYTACFRHTNNNCYVCKVENEGDGNTCASTWVWNGEYVDENLGYNPVRWYSAVPCPQTSSSSSNQSSSSSGTSSNSTATVTCKLPSTLVSGTVYNRTDFRAFVECSNGSAPAANPTFSRNTLFTNSGTGASQQFTVGAAGGPWNITVSANCGTNGGNVNGISCGNVTVMPAGTSSSSSITSNSSSSTTTTPSSSSTGASVACDYQPSFCGGAAFASVLHNSTTMPAEGECLFIGGFEEIQPNLNSAISINGLENICGSDWDNCTYNIKPDAIDGGYYVYVERGEVNPYQNNGWQNIVAGTKLNCNTSTTATLPTSHLPLATSHSSLYYNLKGEPLGTAKPTASGVYIVRNPKTGQTQKMVVK